MRNVRNVRYLPIGLAWVVSSKEPGALQILWFGFTPHQSETCRDLLNVATDRVRMEVDDDNDDDSDYDRLMDIFIRPDFSEPIRAYRCVVLVDAFVVTS